MIFPWCIQGFIFGSGKAASASNSHSRTWARGITSIAVLNRNHLIYTIEFNQIHLIQSSHSITLIQKLRPFSCTESLCAHPA